MKVLIVENSRLYTQFLSRLFRDLGLEPVVVTHSDDPLSQLDHDDWGLACMSMVLRDTSAVELAKDVRCNHPHLPLFVLTSDHSDETRSRAMASGITELIYKSTIPEMTESITELVRKYVLSDLDEARVLYVEDSRTEAAFVIRLLQSMRLEVHHRVTAEAAIACFESNAFDLVVSDVLLKGKMSGLALVEHIRTRTDGRQRVPVLTITGFDDAKRRIELLRAGTNDYIVKPVIKEELTVRVSNLIENKKLFDKVMEQRRKLHELAITDPLTGCLNRRGFGEFTQAALDDDGAGDGPVALMMIDLDYFKTINDRFGHDMGDKVLSEVGKTLASTRAPHDVVGRLGGEEFAILLPGSSKREATNAAQRLRRAIESSPIDDVVVTASIGVTAAETRQIFDLDSALSTADKAVYSAKQRGRNRVSYRKLPR